MRRSILILVVTLSFAACSVINSVPDAKSKVEEIAIDKSLLKANQVDCVVDSECQSGYCHLSTRHNNADTTPRKFCAEPNCFEYGICISETNNWCCGMCYMLMCV